VIADNVFGCGDVFRAGLLDYWEGRCAITGLAVTELLRASHIKPWASCDTDAERLDVFNGLLLAPQLDAAFDCGLITVEDDGTVVVSQALPVKERGSLGLEKPGRVPARSSPRHGRPDESADTAARCTSPQPSISSPPDPKAFNRYTFRPPRSILPAALLGQFSTAAYTNKP